MKTHPEKTPPPGVGPGPPPPLLGKSNHKTTGAIEPQAKEKKEQNESKQEKTPKNNARISEEIQNKQKTTKEESKTNETHS